MVQSFRPSCQLPPNIRAFPSYGHTTMLFLTDLLMN
jgi:hypothetical protein